MRGRRTAVAGKTKERKKDRKARRKKESPV